MEEYLRSKHKTGNRIEALLLGGARVFGQVERDSGDGLFFVGGWWINPAHVVAVRPT